MRRRYTRTFIPGEVWVKLAFSTKSHCSYAVSSVRRSISLWTGVSPPRISTKLCQVCCCCCCCCCYSKTRMGCANRKLARKTPDVSSTSLKSTCDKNTTKKRRERSLFRALLLKRKGKTESCTTSPSSGGPETPTYVVVASSPLVRPSVMYNNNTHR